MAQRKDHVCLCLRVRWSCLLLAGVALLIGCNKADPKGIEVDEPLHLLIEEVDIAITMDVASVINSPLAEPLRGLVNASDDDIKNFLAAFSECGMQGAQTKVTMAADIASDGGEYLFIVESPGIGTSKKVNCMDAKIRAAEGEGPARLFYKRHGDIQMSRQEEGGWLLLINKNLAVLASDHFTDLVLKRVDDLANAKPTELAKLIAKTEPAGIRVMALGSEPLLSELGMEEASGLKEAIILIDLKEESTLHSKMQFDTAENATAIQEEYAPALEEIRGSLVEEMGVSQTLADSLSLTRAESLIELKLTITVPDLLMLGQFLAE